MYLAVQGRQGLRLPRTREMVRRLSHQEKIVREAVIVSTARTPIGKAYRGAFNNTEAPTLAGHVIAAAVQRAKIEPGQVEDVILGCAMQE